MEKTKNKKNKNKGEEIQNTVDRLLLSLQKSISRVNRDSANIDSDKAQSLIVGDIDFSISFKCNLISDERLLVKDDGTITLSLSGKIDTDVGIKNLEETTDE